MKSSRLMKILLGAAVCSLMFTGCTKGQKGDTVIVLKAHQGQPLAQVGKVMLSVEELKKDFLERQGQFKGAPNLNTEKARTDYVENQVMQEAMFQEAISLGYFERSDVLRDVKKIVVQKLMREKLENSQTAFEPSEEQLKEHYEKNANLYNREESVKAAYISVPFGSNKAKAKEIAAAIHKEAVQTVKNGNTKVFSRLALNHAPKAMGISAAIETNETDFLEKAAFDTKFGSEAFEAAKSAPEVGEIGPLVATENAFVILLKTGYRKAISESLADAKPKIIKRLAYENRGDLYKKYLEDLRKKYEIKVFADQIAELSKGVTPPSAAAAKAPVPGHASAAPQNANQAPAAPTPPAPTDEHANH